ncbi:hypothetical protein VP277E431_P0161 [Vibrio phage 277E43-1]|nr:hypothetical protein VP277E431_P0161 [Vibrio phage 277E43-1]
MLPTYKGNIKTKNIPLSLRKGFLYCKLFSKVNYLVPSVFSK